MISRFRTTGLAIIFMLIMFAGFALAQAPNPERSGDNYFKTRCEDLKYTCGTSFFDDRVEVSCSYPPADWKGQPVYADMVVTYRCHHEKQGGMGVLVCKGFMGLSPDTQATFTPEEFKDAQTRCTRLCKPCPKGWK
jgi:hypothetical protein